MGDCWADVAALHDQPGLFGSAAWTATAWRVLDRVDEPLLGELRAARQRVRLQAGDTGRQLVLI